MTNANAYKCLVYALKPLVFFSKYQLGYTNAVFFFHCMYAEGMSRRWRDTAPFEQCGLTCYFEHLFTCDLDHGTCCNIEMSVLCILCELSSIA